MDVYRWMEDEGPDLHTWVSTQARAAEAHLTALPDRAELLARITELTAGTARNSRFQAAAGHRFHLRPSTEGGVPALISDDRVLLDPNDLPGAEHHNLDWYSPSPDGRHIAVGLSQGGSEQSALRLLDVTTGTLSDTAIPGTFHGVTSWLPDATGLLYHRYPTPAPDTPPAQRRWHSGTWLHRLGTDPAEDVLILARHRNPHVPLEPRDRPFVLAPAGSDWLVAVISHAAIAGGRITQGLGANSIYVAPRAALADPASCPWRRVCGPADRISGHTVHGDTLYLVSDAAAPRGAVLAVPLAAPDLASVRVVVPGGDRAVAAVHVIGDHLLVLDVDAGISKLRRLPLTGGGDPAGGDGDGGDPGGGDPAGTAGGDASGAAEGAAGGAVAGVAVDVPLPVAGTIEECITHPDGESAVLVVGALTRSARAYRCDPRTGALTDTGWLPPTGLDELFAGITVTDRRVPARDGTPIPLTVLHRADLPLDGTNPALLSAYGSYGFVRPRRCEPELLAWLERGGVYAIAGVRGGGEFGAQWHQAGRGPNKERTITDFLDCAAHLVAAGYTSPPRLAGEGGSAGGIPTGGALVRRPDAWGAMVMQVPVTNLTRMEFTENGPMNVPEFGTVSTEDGRRDLLIIDSYLRVADGVAYPAVLLTAGLNDPRVPVWQAGKMAARLRDASSSGRPVLLRVDPHAGHGRGSTQAQRDELYADIFAFLFSELRERPTAGQK